MSLVKYDAFTRRDMCSKTGGLSLVSYLTELCSNAAQFSLERISTGLVKKKRKQNKTKQSAKLLTFQINDTFTRTSGICIKKSRSFILKN